jgi:hypothetical protein
MLAIAGAASRLIERDMSKVAAICPLVRRNKSKTRFGDVMKSSPGEIRRSLPRRAA